MGRVRLMKLYRIAKSKRATDLSGEGARICGGRWNSRGTPMLYTSEHISLAALEVSVHLNSLMMKLKHSYITIEIPEGNKLITELSIDDLSSNWRSYPAPELLKSLGDKFVRDLEFLALKVPSVLSPSEFNYLLNPLHRRYSEVRISHQEDFLFDPRIKQDNE